MNAVFAKLNYKPGATIYVLNAPESFAPAVDEMRAACEVRADFAKAKQVTFALAFATTKKEVDASAERIAKAAAGDAVVWVAYPKASSKRYRCDFNRDTGWDRLGAHGFEPVRQVAIDDDWSALRFRRVEFIRTMTRGFAMTAAGKEKALTRRAARR
jgi:hypothetical protein